MCKQTTIKPGTVLEKPLIDFYLKNDKLNDPLITRDRIKLMKILDTEDLDFIIDLTLKVNEILESFLKVFILNLLILNWNLVTIQKIKYYLGMK